MSIEGKIYLRLFALFWALLFTVLCPALIIGTVVLAIYWLRKTRAEKAARARVLASVRREVQQARYAALMRTW